MGKRTVYWGHWDITFWRDAGERYYGDPGTLIASVGFPVGTRGPMDNMPGQRHRLRDICAAWIERGELPPTAIPAVPRVEAA